MRSPPTERLAARLTQKAYCDSRSIHGVIGVDRQDFAAHLSIVIARRLGSSPTQAATRAFFDNLHASDLYLAIACAQERGPGRDGAWHCFLTHSKRHIDSAARSACATREAARDLAASIPGHVFLPDRSGRSRLAGYDGSVSLSAWLRAITKNRAIDERRLRENNNESVDCLPREAEPTSAGRVELTARANSYRAVILNALELAVESLTERDCRLLTLRYIEDSNGAEIARSLGMHRSTITRRLAQVQSKLREKVTSVLATESRLNDIAIQECLIEIMENPAYSILQLLADPQRPNPNPSRPIRNIPQLARKQP
jgi:RNA polymerase sigma-70 factor